MCETVNSEHNFIYSDWKYKLAISPIFCSLSKRSFHTSLLTLFVLLFVVVPFGVLFYTDWVKDTHGYVVTSGSWSPIARNVVELRTADCTAAP